MVEEIMKTYISNFISDSSKWWLLWGIISPILVIACFFSAIWIDNRFLLLEFLPSAFFGLWIYNKSNFYANLIKFIFLLLLLIPLILFLGMPFVWISISVLLLAMWLFKFKKEAFLWSFGVMLLYGFLSIIPLSLIIFFNDFDLQQSIESVIYNISSIIAVVFAGYFVKGAIFAAILEMKLKKNTNLIRRNEYPMKIVEKIETFAKVEDDVKIREFIVSIEIGRFCAVLEDFPLLKKRIIENVSSRVIDMIEQKIVEYKTLSLSKEDKEEILCYAEKIMDKICKR